MKTKTKINGYILRSGAAALLFLSVVVGFSSAINPKFPTSQNNIAVGVNGHGSSPSDCMPNDYTITTGTGAIVPGTTDTGNHADQGITPIALPFPVTFYDQTFFSVGISANGNLQFTGANANDFANLCLPTLGMTDLIAPYWADLYDADTANGQGVFTSVSGTAPSRIFNIEFRENVFGVQGPPLLDFEVRLHEDTPNFEIIYGALNGNTGANATVGAQRDSGSHSTQFECNTGGLGDGLQLNFVYAFGCASPTPTPTPTASPIPCDNYTTSTTTGNTITPGDTDTGNHCDDCVTTITFPFPVTVYAYTFTSANVSSNGSLDLSGTPSYPTSGCLTLPDPLWDRAIFAFQEDLTTSNPGAGCAGYPGGMCGIYTSVTGTAPNRQFNIEWRAVDANTSANPFNFEVVFYENTSGLFDIFYGVTGDNGINATSGVQASGAGPATTFSCGTGTLTSGLKVTYSCPAVSPTPTPTPTATATATFTPTPTPTPTPCTLAAPNAGPATNVTLSSFTANWHSGGGGGATGYRLDVSTNDRFTTYVAGYQDLDVQNVTSFTVIGLSAETTYFYRVRAYNGCATSRNSNVRNAQTLPCTPPAPNAQPETDVTFSSFTANWSNVNGATDYRLDVSTSNTFTTYVYQNLDVGNVTSFPVTGLSANTHYYYRVRAYNGCDTSRNSNVQNVQTLPCTPAAPNAQPATNVTASSFTANWSSVNGAIDYQLDVSTSNTFTTYVYQNLDVGNATSFPVTGLNAHTTYYYRVRAYNGCGTSPNSNVRSVQTTH